MSPMDAWSIISKNLKQLYATRYSLGIRAYTADELEAETICFRALKNMQKQEDDCK